VYSHGPDDGSDYRKRIERDCDTFVDIRALSTIDAARRIRDDGIDILVDLKGHTQGQRLDICALRPAPVQVTYLGFPGTTGASFFDYVITDRIVTPEDQAPYYSETFVYLPNCYQVNDHTQAISQRPCARADFGLPDDGFVFCSFNKSYKIEPVMWDVWMRILRHVDGGILWLLHDNETAADNLKREAAARDVDPRRIVFTGRLAKAEHLARLKLADLFLDTRVSNAHTTGSDALWAGLPLITLQGVHFASRVGSSLLTAIGLPELIAHGIEAYEALAIRLAGNPDELAAVGNKLWRNRLVEPLFDTPRFARNLEAAYTRMWEAYLGGEQRQIIDVVETGAPSPGDAGAA
jgi:predicted O-linked N-acetylglucosamine transferase (SPINDLY family)